MKKLWPLFLLPLTAGVMERSADAQSTVVYAAEYNQSTNRFGTVDLLSGNFTQIASFGPVVINDIAFCPTNGKIYGISNKLALITFNQTNGSVAKIANLSATGIETLAFRQSDGALFGGTQSKLYQINPANGTATSVGNYGTPTKLGATGQNIRFARDGNLYLSNTSTNTDIYRISTTTGAATWMGEAVGYPYLILENTSSNMYGVFINLNSTSNAVPELANLDLSSFVLGGTNANGSTHQITINLVGAGTNFPPNFNFSGSVSQAITNLTVPVSATGPSNQTTVVGSTVVFGTTASGTGPFNYTWLKSGSAIGGQTNSSLTLTDVTTSAAATYSVIVGGAMGMVTNSAILTVTKAAGSIALASLSQTYNGTAKAATANTVPSGLAVSFTYNGSAAVPTNAGSYVVIGTITDPNYQGAATNTLVIAQASASIALAGLSQNYNGSAKAATATTVPSGLAVSFSYNGSAAVPVNAGSYVVIGTITDPNYQGGATNTMIIARASATIALANLSQTYNGSPKAATANTVPSGLPVSFTYNGLAAVPTNAGSYVVIGTITDPNYQGTATNTMVVASASASIALANLSQAYDGSAKAAMANTVPSGLPVSFTYNGSTTVPTNAGSYQVIGTITDPNYQGTATNTMVVASASASITLVGLSQTYDGSAKAAMANTVPSGLPVSFTYNGSTTVPTNAGSYQVIATITDPNYQGSATNTMVIASASASITLVDLSQTYDGSAKAAMANTIPDGLPVSFTYNGSNTVPTNAGGYLVIGTITDPNYQGSATNTMVIASASASIMLADLSQTYDGSAKAATANTIPDGLPVSFTYNGSTTAPTNAGGYLVIGTITDSNYQGSATNTMVIASASASIALVDLSQTYDGTAKVAMANTVPSGLPVSFTYNESTTAPTNAGSYVVIGTITDPNYQGSATNTMVIASASASVALVNLSQTYDGSAKAAMANTIPDGLPVGVTYNGSATVPTNAGSYLAIGAITDPNYQGSATNTMVIASASASIALANLSQTYDGTAKAATASTVPSSLPVSFTYNGLANIPTNTGSYVVIGTITDLNYQGSATNTMVVASASASITLVDLSQTYDGSAKAATANTVPSGLPVSFTYNGSTMTPTNAGSYVVIGMISDPNYQGSATNTLVIASASASITLVDLSQTYDGSAKAAMASTLPSGLPVSFTYNGSTTAPTNAGSYVVIGTITDPNYQGTATNTLVINALMLTATNLLVLDKVYDCTTNATLDATNAWLSGVLNSDSVTLVMSDAMAYFADKNAGSNKTVMVTGLALGGAAAANYSLAELTNLTASITPATLTITADNKSRTVGQANPSLTACCNGFVGDDNTNVFSSPAVLSTTATVACAPGNYPITASDAIATNYTMHYVNGTLSVRSILSTQLAGSQASVNGTGQYIVSWPTVSGQTYQLEYNDDLTSNAWTPAGTPFPGTDGIISVTNNLGASPQRFFRVQVQ